MAFNSNMSVISGKTARTSLSSILKSYAPSEREKTKTAIINKVRFNMPKKENIIELVQNVEESQNLDSLKEYASYLSESEMEDSEFATFYNDARTIINLLSPKFTVLVEALLSQSWTKRNTEARKAYSEFCLDLLVAHSKYLQFGITKLIASWIPSESDEPQWEMGTPSAQLSEELQAIHLLLQRILNAIPMAMDAVLDAAETLFPYYRKSTHIVVGYVHNLLQLLQYKPMFAEYLVQLLMQNLIVLDVHAPRAAIEEAESDDEDDEEEEQEMFEMDDAATMTPKNMNHPIAHTLDIVMMKIFDYVDTNFGKFMKGNDIESQQKTKEALKFCQILIKSFDNTILPIHNTHHAQFVLFYFCSLNQSLAETFLVSLWDKIKNPNCSAVIRQAAVGYMASFLARSKFVSIVLVKYYLKELCSWAHKYIRDCDQYRSNGSLKANLVFFSVCQAVFYVIAFRSRDLTTDKKSLLFLQSLHLSALVTCNFNPLRVCLPAVATAFAGVTRAYQLAYCHAILERNARRKLATVYANDTATPEEVLDTFFPFDPYLLKLSGQRITPIYLVYQASEGEEHSAAIAHSPQGTLPLAIASVSRKRGDSEMMDDHDVDDFILSDKRQRLASLSRSQERENQFTYGLSPGFHM